MTGAAPDFYEVLGVARDATPEQIKQAFRKASSAAHPDKPGGSDERQQQVNRAYEVLSDPQRRKDYDNGGLDQDALGIEDEGRMQLASLFESMVGALLNASEEAYSVRTMSMVHFPTRAVDVVREVRGELVKRMEACRREVDNAKRLVKTLQKIRVRVKRKTEGVNLFQIIVDKKIANTQATIPLNERLVKTCEVSLRHLADYENVAEASAQQEATDPMALPSVRRFLGGPRA